MIFKYFVMFDEGGDIGCMCNSKPTDCSEDCNEYIVKLTPIERSEVSEVVDNFTDSVNRFHSKSNKLISEMSKAVKLRRSFKK